MYCFMKLFLSKVNRYGDHTRTGCLSKVIKVPASSYPILFQCCCSRSGIHGTNQSTSHTRLGAVLASSFAPQAHRGGRLATPTGPVPPPFFYFSLSREERERERGDYSCAPLPCIALHVTRLTWDSLQGSKKKRERNKLQSNHKLTMQQLVVSFRENNSSASEDVC